MRMKTSGRQENRLLAGSNSTTTADRTRRWDTGRRLRSTAGSKQQRLEGGSRLRRNFFQVLDSLRCLTLRSDSAQLTACEDQYGKSADASCESNCAVKHRRPLRGGKGMPVGESLSMEAPASIFSMSEKCDAFKSWTLGNFNMITVPFVVSSIAQADWRISTLSH